MEERGKRPLEGAELASGSARRVKGKKCGAPGPFSAERRRLLLGNTEELRISSHAGAFNALPVDVLLQIFSNLQDLSSFRLVLPLVCRQWADLLTKPVGVWNHVELDLLAERETTGAVGKVDENKLVSWVKPRASAIKSVRLKSSGLLQHSAHRAPDFSNSGFQHLLGLLRSSLQELVIERCSLVINSTAIATVGCLSNLKVLNLKSLQAPLQKADIDALAGLKGLEELALDCDEPPETEEFSFQEEKWGLQYFPEALVHLTNMTHLTLSTHYGLTSLPPSISKLNKLEVLNLDFCTLSQLPPSLGKLTALTTLDVEGNMSLGSKPAVPAAGSPASFPAELSGLSNLRYLNLNSCGLDTVPEVVGRLHSLETLDLEGNELGEVEEVDAGFPATLTDLSQLRCLNVAQCKLAKVPSVVERLHALRILDLTNNRITNAGLSRNLTKLRNLKAIGLKKNRLTYVPHLLGDMPTLQEIYLEDNRDLEVTTPLDFLVDLPALTILMMGKELGSWTPVSMHFMTDLASKLKVKYPMRDILRISYPGQPLDVDEEEEGKPWRMSV